MSKFQPQVYISTVGSENNLIPARIRPSILSSCLHFDDQTLNRNNLQTLFLNLFIGHCNGKQFIIDVLSLGMS